MTKSIIVIGSVFVVSCVFEIFVGLPTIHAKFCRQKGEIAIFIIVKVETLEFIKFNVPAIFAENLELF